MKTTIKFTPAKLDKLANEHFAEARNIDFNSLSDRESDGRNLSGIALRRWAVSLRAARAEKWKRIGEIEARLIELNAETKRLMDEKDEILMTRATDEDRCFPLWRSQKTPT